MDELKPCPFCGGDAIIKAYHKDYDDKCCIVSCVNCDVETPMYEFRADAIEAWNRRAYDGRN